MLCVALFNQTDIGESLRIPGAFDVGREFFLRGGSNLQSSWDFFFGVLPPHSLNYVFVTFFFPFFFIKNKCCFDLLVRGRWRISQVPGDFSTQEICSLLRTLTYEAERTLDLPRHGAARACPWLSTALVAGSVRRGRGGDWYSQRPS